MLDAQQMSQLGDSIETAEIDDLAVTFAKLAVACQRQLVPVGTILAWAKTIVGTPALPTGWVECDGAAINDADSPMNGQNVPDLDAQELLYGLSTSGTTKNENYLPSHAHGYIQRLTSHAGAAGTPSGETTSSTSSGTALKCYSVVFIIKIK